MLNIRKMGSKNFDLYLVKKIELKTCLKKEEKLFNLNLSIIFFLKKANSYQ